MEQPFVFSDSWSCYLAVGAKLGWAVLLAFAGLPPVGQLYGIGVTLLEVSWLLAGVPQAAGPYSLITLQASLGLFRGSSASQKNTRESPSVRALFQLLLVPFLLRSRWPKRGLRLTQTQEARGGGIGSVSLGEEGELRACFEVAHAIASEMRTHGQSWGGRTTEACSRVALR